MEGRGRWELDICRAQAAGAGTAAGPASSSVARRAGARGRAPRRRAAAPTVRRAAAAAVAARGAGAAPAHGRGAAPRRPRRARAVVARGAAAALHGARPRARPPPAIAAATVAAIPAAIVVAAGGGGCVCRGWQVGDSGEPEGRGLGSWPAGAWLCARVQPAAARRAGGRAGGRAGAQPPARTGRRPRSRRRRRRSRRRRCACSRRTRLRGLQARGGRRRAGMGGQGGCDAAAQTGPGRPRAAAGMARHGAPLACHRRRGRPPLPAGRPPTPPAAKRTRDLAAVDARAVQLLARLLGVLDALELHKREGLLDLAALQPDVSHWGRQGRGWVGGCQQPMSDGRAARRHGAGDKAGPSLKQVRQGQAVAAAGRHPAPEPRSPPGAQTPRTRARCRACGWSAGRSLPQTACGWAPRRCGVPAGRQAGQAGQASVLAERPSSARQLSSAAGAVRRWAHKQHTPRPRPANSEDSCATNDSSRAARPFLAFARSRASAPVVLAAALPHTSPERCQQANPTPDAHLLALPHVGVVLGKLDAQAAAHAPPLAPAGVGGRARGRAGGRLRGWPGTVLLDCAGLERRRGCEPTLRAASHPGGGAPVQGMDAVLGVPLVVVVHKAEAWWEGRQVGGWAGRRVGGWATGRCHVASEGVGGPAVGGARVGAWAWLVGGGRGRECGRAGRALT